MNKQLTVVKRVKHLACVASVSNRVITRRLERKQKKGIHFFCSCPSFLDEPREETLATQAIKHPIGDHIKRRLYNTFILPAFNYCNNVWHFCSKRSKDKLEQFNKQALRTVLNSNLEYETLLKIIGSVNLESSRVQTS